MNFVMLCLAQYGLAGSVDYFFVIVLPGVLGLAYSFFSMIDLSYKRAHLMNWINGQIILQQTRNLDLGPVRRVQSLHFYGDAPPLAWYRHLAPRGTAGSFWPTKMLGALLALSVVLVLIFKRLENIVV